MEKIQLSPLDFKDLIKKYENNREINEIFYTMKVLNTRVLSKHGIYLPEEHM